MSYPIQQINLGLDEAVVAVESEDGCEKCMFIRLFGDGETGCNGDFLCHEWKRHDGKSVVYDTIDLKEICKRCGRIPIRCEGCPLQGRVSGR